MTGLTPADEAFDRSLIFTKHQRGGTMKVYEFGAFHGASPLNVAAE